MERMRLGMGVANADLLSCRQRQLEGSQPRRGGREGHFLPAWGLARTEPKTTGGADTGGA